MFVTPRVTEPLIPSSFIYFILIYILLSFFMMLPKEKENKLDNTLKSYPSQRSFLKDLTCRVLFSVFTSVMRCFRISEGRPQKRQKVLKVLKASL